MTLLAALLTLTLVPDTLTLEERIDRYHPTTGAYLGAERTWYDADGRRMRREESDASGRQSLVFVLLHDGTGRERGALYIEEGADGPSQELFTYSPDGRLKTATYYYEPGVAADRTESDLDEVGREVAKRYFRSDGSQYGAEDVLWSQDLIQGWDFRYVDREGGVSFRYVYEAFHDDGGWARRTRFRDGAPERAETRTVRTSDEPSPLHTMARFAPGVVSTNLSETSPSFSRDGTVMVFARYGDDWGSKDPYIAFLEDEAWRVEPLDWLGPVYNLAISPDGRTLVYAATTQEGRSIWRARRQGAGWAPAENLTTAYGIVGAYPTLTEEGHLLLYDEDAAAGGGVYIARRQGEGFATALPLFIPGEGTAFDPFARSLDDALLVAWCVDDVCGNDGINGIWALDLRNGLPGSPRLVRPIPYSWGVQPVPPLGILVVTDGEDILTVPLGVLDPAVGR